MHLRFSPEDEAFRREVAAWLSDALTGEFACVRGRGGPGDEHAMVDERRAWEKKLASGGWTCVGWPLEYGGRGATLMQQVIYFEEYARAGGPGRLGHIGEGLLGPTVIAFGSEEQKRRFCSSVPNAIRVGPRRVSPMWPSRPGARERAYSSLKMTS